MVFSKLGYELIKICVCYIAIKAGHKYDFFLPYKRISDEKVETTCRFKMKEDGCSFGTSAGKVVRSSFAELFHTYIWNLKLSHLPVKSVRKGMSLEKKGFCQEPPWFLWGKQSGDGGVLGTFSLLCLRFTSRVLLLF